MAAVDASWLAQFDAHTSLAVGELVLIGFVPIALITVGAGVLARLARLSWGQTAVVCLLPVGILEAAILSFIAGSWLVGHLDLLVF
ncbi:MAG TPA: hypothetical protein VFR68_15755 [Candidatus Dormibacteraeota bacterium]|nr:hypothetical protein [Candidatus Dormibacteraeota bacterium]